MYFLRATIIYNRSKYGNKINPHRLLATGGRSRSLTSVWELSKVGAPSRHGNGADHGRFLPPPNPNSKTILIPRPKPHRGWRIKTQTRPKRVRLGPGIPVLPPSI